MKFCIELTSPWTLLYQYNLGVGKHFFPSDLFPEENSSSGIPFISMNSWPVYIVWGSLLPSVFYLMLFTNYIHKNSIEHDYTIAEPHLFFSIASILSIVFPPLNKLLFCKRHWCMVFCKCLVIHVIQIILKCTLVWPGVVQLFGGGGAKWHKSEESYLQILP
jgi:hypothetical protein